MKRLDFNLPFSSKAQDFVIKHGIELSKMIDKIFIDLFFGIVGFRLGLEKAGFQSHFSSKIDKHFRLTYKKDFRETPSGDITKISLSAILDYELLADEDL